MNTLNRYIGSIKKNYTRVPRFLVANMRLLVLILFATLAGFLVIKVNILVNKDLVTTEVRDKTLKSTTISPPDKDVISVFNELNTQDITLGSDFTNNRQNPF